MKNLATKIERTSAELTTAVVVGVNKDSLIVEEGGLSYDAIRGTGCVIAPEQGDRVLVAHDEHGEAYVISVLDHSGSSTPRLEIDGDLEIRTPRGRLDVSARDGVNLCSATEINLTAPALNLRSEVGRLVMENMVLAGRVAQAGFDRVRLTAKSGESLVERLFGRFKARFATVEGLDQARAGTLVREVDGANIVNSGHTIVRAEKDVKIDGQQIIMG